MYGYITRKELGKSSSSAFIIISSLMVWMCPCNRVEKLSTGFKKGGPFFSPRILDIKTLSQFCDCSNSLCAKKIVLCLVLANFFFTVKTDGRKSNTFCLRNLTPVSAATAWQQPNNIQKSWFADLRLFLLNKTKPKKNQKKKLLGDD